MWIRSHECRCPWGTEEGVGSSRAGVVDGSELPGVGTGNYALFLRKNSKCSYLLGLPPQLAHLFFRNEWHLCVQAGSKQNQRVRFYLCGPVSVSLGLLALSGHRVNGPGDTHIWILLVASECNCLLYSFISCISDK